MRAELAVEASTEADVVIEIRGREVAILQAQIDVVGDRLANAGNPLKRNRAIGVAAAAADGAVVDSLSCSERWQGRRRRRHRRSSHSSGPKSSKRLAIAE